MAGTALGSYKSAYWRITINSPVELTSILDLPPAGQAVYIHEYTHFLIGVTTTSGVIYSSLVLDRARQLLAKAQKCGPQLHLPLQGPEVEEQKKFLEVMENKVRGMYKCAIDDGHLRVIDVRLRPIRDIKEMEDARIPAVELLLVNAQAHQSTYIFGSDAVEETLAQLMEESIDDANISMNFPYTAGKRLAEYFDSPVSYNKEWLFALCEVSLMGPYPGMHFYNMLRKIYQRRLKLNSASEFYEFCYQSLSEDGYNIWELYENAKDTAKHVTGKLWGEAPEFSDTRSWFDHILDIGLKLRRHNPSLLLQLFLTSPSSKTWNDILYYIGLPETINSTPIRYMNAPPALAVPTEQIEPMFLMVFAQIISMLLHGATSCQFQAVCQASATPGIVDHRCSTMPWERANVDPLCAVGVMWRYFQLHEKKVVLGTMHS